MSGLRKSVKPLEKYVAKLESQSQHETNMWVKQESKNRKVQLSQGESKNRKGQLTRGARNTWGLVIHALGYKKRFEENVENWNRSTKVQNMG